jgi:ribosomal RNA adenine dimethylase
MVETYILPWTPEGLNPGSDVLEVGPGPGASTDLLRARVARLTCAEADYRFAEKLRRRLDQSVCVMCQDAMAVKLLAVRKEKMFENSGKRIFYQDKISRNAVDPNAYTASVPGKGGTCSCRVTLVASVSDETAKKIALSLGPVPE